MGAKSEAVLKAWCPFCGMDVPRPRESAQRKMTEFPVGTCECGAVYVADATGHNIGSAMVECLVYACNDEWDLAWELIPEEDYLTGRIEDYDEVTHQVVPKRNLDGRAVRGVLYFVRLHTEISEIVARFQQKQNQDDGKTPTGGGDPAAEKQTPSPVPVKVPGGPKRRTGKREVKALVDKNAVDELAALCFEDKRTLRFLQRLLYQPDPCRRYKTAWIMGQVCAQVSNREPGPVADLLHRLFEACSDSAATPWGMVEAIGAIIALRSDIYGAFTRHLLNFMGDPSTQEAVLWGLGEIAGRRPDLIRSTPFYSTFHFLGHDNPVVRGLMVRLLGRIQADEALMQIIGLQQDDSEVTYFEQGDMTTTTVADLAFTAVALIRHDRSGTGSTQENDNGE
ncbi:MAG TPA: PBS lyase [Desulfobulbus sp.]|nr:PBS lyase [Desulfobulbus sp.]